MPVAWSVIALRLASEVRSQNSEVRSQQLLTFRSLAAMQRGLGGSPHERLHQDNVKHLNA
ncbi:hypothetical protein [Moorena producens]|uniref:hypothetical protein n=1 Tax=Moorena producens TaxID=1155739 RepID=UPI0011EA6E28|nr:hypothetical protein [Moorena producens]